MAAYGERDAVGEFGGFELFFSFDDAVVVGLFGPVSDVDNLDVDAATTSLTSQLIRS